MLGIFLRNVSSRRFQLGTHVLRATASDLTPLELKTFRMAAIDAGATRISFIEEVVASSLGAEIRTDFEHAAVVVNMGADTTDLAVVNAGESVQDRTLRNRTADSPISHQKNYSIPDISV